MEKLLKPEDTLNNRISYYLVALLLLSLPYNLFYSHLFLIGLAVHTIVQIRKDDVKPVFTKATFALTAVFFVTLFSIIYTSNRPQGFTELGRQVTILLIPLICCFNTLDFKKYRDNLLLLFSAGCVVAIIYLFLQALYTIRFYHLPFRALASPTFTNHNFSEPLEIHATFFSMQIGIGLIYFIYRFIIQSRGWLKIVYFFCCTVLAVGIVQLSAKSVFIAIIVVVNIAVPLFLLSKGVRKKFITVAASVSLLVIAGIFTADAFKDRFVTEFKKDLSKPTDVELTDPRLARWSVALNVAAQSPVIGHGAGTEIDLLQDPFFDHHFYRSYLAELNAHNQFISFFIKSGVIGVLIYLFVLVFGFRTAIIKRDILLLSFMLIITCVSFSENFLDVDKGIFFYGVFFSLFFFSSQAQQTENQHKITV
ncbi:O-antigen ligase family protein [Mucilaginibacter celer]|uniref:O-antigen ligase family protein n=1 Tax=Mucilaginibacter celer TaxID=2305508 RepID=A0A494VXM8_9SPHI|nr:O-antigen ligase family protein [Mucilaginibacter celer]AYL96005.1 O-antigen ligase family protein [Mucilaginibacter celer]